MQNQGLPVIIANPIYDVVFKYLLEDTEIAREFLGLILGVKIVTLELKPQETLVKDESGGVKIFHLDFKAFIAMADGSKRVVLIELQKAKRTHDILRFRKYLGENYIKEETRINEHGQSENYAVEIVTIYMLGYKLKGVEVPVLKVSREFTDAITNAKVKAKNDFISMLTHESYTIQIPRLRHDQRNKLEEVLEIFSQDYLIEGQQEKEYYGTPKTPLLKKMVRRLSKAASSVEIRRNMDVEDLVDQYISR